GYEGRERRWRPLPADETSLSASATSRRRRSFSSASTSCVIRALRMSRSDSALVAAVARVGRGAAVPSERELLRAITSLHSSPSSGPCHMVPTTPRKATTSASGEAEAIETDRGGDGFAWKTSNKALGPSRG